MHLGLVLLAVGVIGSHLFQLQRDAFLKAGQEVNVAGYRLLYLGNIDTKVPDQEIVTAQLEIWRDGQLQRYIYPGRVFYRHFDNQPASQISITTFGVSDLYVVLNQWDGAGQATLQIFVNPLVPLVWYGGLLMLLGGILCWWPERKRVARAAINTAHVTTTAKDEEAVV